jgi:1,4-dihydroxy-2-naphthoyl-CoA hydrolase
MSTQEHTTNAVPPERGLSQTLQMTIVEQSPDRVVMTMPVTAYHLQPWGYLHGGASIALAETAATLGAFLNCPPDMVAFGQEINANHLRPVREGMLTATATPLHVGRTSQVWDIHIRDEQNKLICASRCTLAVISTNPRDETNG